MFGGRFSGSIPVSTLILLVSESALCLLARDPGDPCRRHTAYYRNNPDTVGCWWAELCGSGDEF